MLLSAVFLLVATASGGEARSPVPAIMLFGDSLVDVGNNDYIHHTVIKANFPPYGRDFKGHVPTGRFCNGKLLSDIIGKMYFKISYIINLISGERQPQNVLGPTVYI